MRSFSRALSYIAVQVEGSGVSGLHQVHEGALRGEEPPEGVFGVHPGLERPPVDVVALLLSGHVLRQRVFGGDSQHLFDEVHLQMERERERERERGKRGVDNEKKLEFLGFAHEDNLSKREKEVLFDDDSTTAKKIALVSRNKIRLKCFVRFSPV
jgi:hypothetical protein